MEITGTNCLKGDNGELLVSEEQVSDEYEIIDKLHYLGDMLSQEGGCVKINSCCCCCCCIIQLNKTSYI